MGFEWFRWGIGLISDWLYGSFGLGFGSGSYPPGCFMVGGLGPGSYSQDNGVVLGGEGRVGGGVCVSFCQIILQASFCMQFPHMSLLKSRAISPVPLLRTLHAFLFAFACLTSMRESYAIFTPWGANRKMKTCRVDEDEDVKRGRRAITIKEQLLPFPNLREDTQFTTAKPLAGNAQAGDSEDVAGDAAARAEETNKVCFPILEMFVSRP